MLGKYLLWVFIVVIIAAVAMIVFYLTMSFIEKRIPKLHQHFERYKENYKSIFITIIIVVVLWIYFSQPDDGRSCVAYDGFGCMEWEYE